MGWRDPLKTQLNETVLVFSKIHLTSVGTPTYFTTTISPPFLPYILQKQYINNIGVKHTHRYLVFYTLLPYKISCRYHLQAVGVSNWAFCVYIGSNIVIIWDAWEVYFNHLVGSITYKDPFTGYNNAVFLEFYCTDHLLFTKWKDEGDVTWSECHNFHSNQLPLFST